MITLTTKRATEVYALLKSDPNSLANAFLPPGTFKMVRIPNPRGFGGNWLVRAEQYNTGLIVGASEASFRQWIDYNDEFQVIIEEDQIT